MTFERTDAANDAEPSVKQARERASWVEIQRDEEDALRRQQASAGVTHGPVMGPGPYGDHGVNMAVELAVKAERERCVSIALAWAEQCDGTHRPLEASLARRMAAALTVPPPGNPSLAPTPTS